MAIGFIKTSLSYNSNSLGGLDLMKGIKNSLTLYVFIKLMHIFHSNVRVYLVSLVKQLASLELQEFQMMTHKHCDS
jgi:hypothetical protein